MNNSHLSNSHLNRLRGAWDMQRGLRKISHAELRMLEKKKLITIYTLKDGSEHPIVLANGRKLLGLD